MSYRKLRRSIERGSGSSARPPADALLSGADLVDPDLLNQVASLPEDERYSFIFRGNAQALDLALTTNLEDLRLQCGLEVFHGGDSRTVRRRDSLDDEFLAHQCFREGLR